jgi:hypothetical protein
MNKTTNHTAYLSVLEIISRGRTENHILPQILDRVNDIAEQMRKGDASVVSCLTEYE